MKKSKRLNLNDFVPYRMSVASNSVSDVVATAYEAMFGLKIPEWRIIAILAEHARITPIEIGALTRMDKMTVSRAAGALTERGLVRRSPNPGDRRSHLLELTTEGAALYGQVAPAALEIERRLLAAFAPEEIAGFVAMLRRIEEVAADFSAQQSAGS